VGLVLLGVVLIGGCGVLIVGWLLWLVCDVGVWLVIWWYGYVDMRDRLMEMKRGYSPHPLTTCNTCNTCNILANTCDRNDTNSAVASTEKYYLVDTSGNMAL